jgi:hypothetical protein
MMCFFPRQLLSELLGMLRHGTCLSDSGRMPPGLLYDQVAARAAVI